MHCDRIKSAAGVATIHALIAFALIRGLGVEVGSEPADELKTFDVRFEPLPPPIVEPDKPKARQEKARAKNPEGAASPKNLRDTPSPIVAPPPIVPLPLPPPPVTVAPVAAEGNRASAGASDVPGPGTGSGGQGTGRGSGEAGDGTGGGGDGGAARLARWIKGRIYDSDYPYTGSKEPVVETVFLSFVVTPKGRVRNCTVHRSSGNPAVDAKTCRLLERRFRFEPARDGEGRAVAQTIHGNHVWGIRPEPPPVDVEPTISDY